MAADDHPSSSSDRYNVPELLGSTLRAFEVDEIGNKRFLFAADGKIEAPFWRLSHERSIICTSEDLQVQDWRGNATNGERARNQLVTRLFAASVVDAYASVPTGDLFVCVEGNVTLELLRQHSFLESWAIYKPGLMLLVDAFGRINRWDESSKSTAVPANGFTLASRSPSDLQALRSRIDEIDANVLTLLNRRARIATEIGDLKRATDPGGQVFRPDREVQIVRRLSELNDGPLPDAAVGHVFREIMSACRALERPAVVAYLGPEGTYSEQAVVAQFGRSVERRACASIDAIFREVESSAADFGVIPVENSTEGTVNRSLDLLVNSPLSICAEVALPIDHHLLTKSGTTDGVTRVCAHPQALAQCTAWLDRHLPTPERVPAPSNGVAAEMAAADPAVAAIAGELAAERYGLVAVASNIQDLARNTTRFAVIGTIASRPSGRDQTSIVFSVANQAGAVHEAIEPLARFGVSMTRFESRPARTGVWVYHFYIDVEGHESDPPVAAALAELRSRAGFFRVLGAYPRRDAATP